ncbi:LacI family DNA-binding transcriptional regulator [Aquamicrobium sp. NLF2-7]|uniref:LacI family DNA-binding transcriptional regulator n=1 Tax=Aquamicrobium sp. NLF2-7 TaxID=2918753 RepID=UPI001EFBBF31|nr:LacI family DNA-binding transcriptional regulator [Aquamicrobium sp. NLF2-7]MCG8273850.1 LacI family DNA-binding transcriptional regulator [Aquamicrobium sp. NLF2-7]
MKTQDRPTAPGFVNAQQVAKRAGVSRSAVSRAFTPGASIAPETRERVMKAAVELGYQVNDLARGLLANRSRLIGLVVTRPEVGFRAHLVASLTRALIRRGNIPFLINTGSNAQEMEAAHSALFGYRAEATIILSGSPPASFVELARQNGQPLVMIGRSEPGCDHVRLDNAEAASEAAAMFVRSGYTRLGLAGSASATPSIVERERAFIAAAHRLGASVAEARGADADYAGGQAAGSVLLGGPHRPQAIFCVNDLIAIGLIDVARRGGVGVPSDLSVIGFDDIPEASWDAYRLATFRQDPDEMAAQAIAQMERRLADPAAPPSIVQLQPVFIRRDSAALKG